MKYINRLTGGSGTNASAPGQLLTLSCPAASTLESEKSSHDNPGKRRRSSVWEEGGSNAVPQLLFDGQYNGPMSAQQRQRERINGIQGQMAPKCEFPVPSNEVQGREMSYHDTTCWT